ncbi:MAG: hypothetical protein ACRDMX_03815 [Solirubrobacteraceae bacterium]
MREVSPQGSGDDPQPAGGRLAGSPPGERQKVVVVGLRHNEGEFGVHPDSFKIDFKLT